MIMLTTKQLFDMNNKLNKGKTKFFHGDLETLLLLPFLAKEDGDVLMYCPSLWDKAARIAQGIMKYKPFFQRNTGTAIHAMLVFLELNGIFLDYTDEELMDIAKRSKQEAENTYLGFGSGKELAQWLKDHAVENPRGKSLSHTRM